MLFKFTASMLISLNLFFCQTALSDNIQNQKYQSSQAKKSRAINLDCFMKTANGTILDLSKLCERKFETLPKTALARKSKEYNYQKIEEFNRRVYGD